jgi:hypothetical protein
MSTFTSNFSTAAATHGKQFTTPARISNSTTLLQGFIAKLRGAMMKFESPSFYENHVSAIFFAMLTEVAMGALLGTLAIYLYTRFMM